jgi:DNA repair exonuclease SbcCD ATPase subunit
MSDLTKDLNHVASEECQQDWNDIRYRDIYRQAFIDGGEYISQQADDTIKQLKQRVGELENERDDWKQKSFNCVEHFTRENRELRNELDALEAHVDKLESIMKELKEDELQCGCGNIHCDWCFDHDVITLALAQSPQTSLSEVKAQAIEDAANKFKFEREIETERMVAPSPEELVDYDDLIDYANKIRNAKDSE